MEKLTNNRSYAIELEGVSKTFEPEGTVVVEALQGFTLAIARRGIVSVVGPSGCGKTTVLNLIAGFLKPSAGRVLVEQDLAGRMKNRSTMVFQGNALFPWMTVFENVEYGVSRRNRRSEEVETIARKYIQLVGLTDFEQSWPKDLSGGMAKRAELARAYAYSPEILLMDEPFGALDIMTRQEMQSLLWNLWMEEPKTVLFATHDIEEAMFTSQKVVVMTPRPGRVAGIFEMPLWDRSQNVRLSEEFVKTRAEIVELFSACSYVK